jgi:alpha/beta superfamily hydrolase
MMTSVGERSLRGSAGRLESIYRRVAGRRVAVLCHSHPQYGGSMFDKVLHQVACTLHDAGVSTLRFNLRGTGASEGRFEGGVGEADDVGSAIDHAAGDHDDVVVVGFSFGAWVGLRVGLGHPRVSRLVGLAIPVDVFDFSFLDGDRKPTLLVQGERDEWGSLAAVESHVTRIGPHVRLQVVSGADHFFHGNLAAVTEAVAGFVAAD